MLVAHDELLNDQVYAPILQSEYKTFKHQCL